MLRVTGSTGVVTSNLFTGRHRRDGQRHRPHQDHREERWESKWIHLTTEVGVWVSHPRGDSRQRRLYRAGGISKPSGELSAALSVGSPDPHQNGLVTVNYEFPGLKVFTFLGATTAFVGPDCSLVTVWPARPTGGETTKTSSR